MLRVFRSRLGWVAGFFLLAHALVVFTLGTRAPGPLFSNAIEFAFGALAVCAGYLAGRRSGQFGRQVWLLVTVSIAIWTVAQGIIFYYDSILHASYLTFWYSDPLIFFWVVPLFMALIMVSTSGQEILDSIQMLDFAQILILAMAAYLDYLFVPSQWADAGQWMAKLGWDATNVRDALLGGGLIVRAFWGRGELARNLFRRVAAFFLLYQIADLVYHYVEEVWNVSTGSPWDLLWSVPFVALIVGASTWNQCDESALTNLPDRLPSIRPLLFLSSAFLPLPVLLVAVEVQKEFPFYGAALVVASLLCSASRLLITQRRRNQSELRYRELVGSSPLPMLVTTPPPEERILLMNQRFTDLFGYTTADVTDVESWWPRAYPDTMRRELVRQEWEARIGAALATGRNAIEPMEVEITCRDGSRRQVEVHMTMEGDGALVIFNDLTDRKKAEAAVRESEELFRQMAVNSPYAFILWDVRSESHVFISPAYETIWGLPPESLYRDVLGWKKALHPEDRERMERRVLGDFQDNPEKEGIEDEFRIIRPDGEIRWVQMHRFPIRNESGEVYRIGGIIQDVSERKQADSALKNEKAFSDAVIDSLPGAFYVIDHTGEVVRWNKNAERILGYSHEELASLETFNVIAEEDRALIVSKWQQALTEGSAMVEAHVLTKDGRKIPFLLTATRAVLGENVYVVGTGIDITERTRAEQGLKESEAHNRALVDESLALICTHALDGTLLSVNPAAATSWGSTPEELVGESLRNLLSPSTRQFFGDYIERIRTNGSDSGLMQVLTKSGKTRLLLYRNLLRQQAGKEPFVLGYAQDITDLRRSEVERETIYEIIAAVSTTPNLQELLAVIHHSLSRVLYAENCYIFLCDPRTKRCEVPFIVDKFDPVPPPPEALERGCAAYVYRTGKPMLIDEKAFQRLVAQGDVDLVGAPSPSWLGVPLATGGEIIGVLAVQHYEDPYAYEERDLEFLSSVANEIALAIEKKRTEETARKAEANLLAIFENTQSSIWSVDTHYHLQAFNSNFKNALRLAFGTEASEGAALFDLLTPSQWTVSKVFYDRALAGEQFTIEEQFNVRGRVADVETSFNPIRADNQIIGVSVTQRSITERKRAEEALRKSEASLAEAQRIALIGSWEWDLVTNVEWWSDEMFRLVGLEPGSTTPTFELFMSSLHPEDRERVVLAAQKAQRERTSVNVEFRAIRSDGEVRQFQSRAEIMTDAAGNAVRMVGTTQDITARKLAEEELRSSREMFYKAFHSSPEPICIMTAEGRFIDVNKAFTDQLGYARGEVIGHAAHELGLDPLAGLDGAQSLSFEQGALRDIEVELSTKTGEARNALVSFERVEIGGLPCVLAQGRDITEHRRAEKALRASDERYRAFISQSQDGVWRVELERPIPVDLPADEALDWLLQYGYIAECNDGMARISGFSCADDLIGKRIGLLVPPTDTKTVESFRSSVNRGWQNRTVELKDVVRDGILKTLQRTEVPIVENGKVIRIWGITRDITELTQAEEALRRSEASLAEAQRIALIGSWEWDLETNEERWSDEMFRLVGAAPGSVRPTFEYFLSFVHPDDREGLIQSGDKAQKDQQSYQFEFRAVRADGAVRIFQSRAEIVRDAEGKAIRMVGATQDVTERKQAEKELRVSEARFRTLIEKAPEAIVVVDLDTSKFVDFNENATHFFGMSREDLLKVGPVEASPPVQPDGRPSSQAALDYLKKAMAGEIPVFDWVHRSAYGKDISCEIRLVRLPASEGNLVRGSITDITERKRVEETLLKLKKAVDTSGEVVFMTDLEGVITSINPEFTRLYGYTEQEVVGKVTPRILKSNMTNPEDHSDLWETVLDKRQYQAEIVNKTKDGRLVNIETSISPILGDREEILGFLAIQRNISDRKRTEDALRASEERYRLLFERSLAGVVRTNRQGRILECNEAFVRIVGCASYDEVLSRNVKNFYFDDKERKDLMDQLEKHGIVAGVELRARRSDGSQAYVLLSASLIENEKEGQTMLATLFDITHWKELDEQLRQALKMEAVGRLAGGVAHDFNNMLQIINGYSELVLDDLAENVSSRAHVQEIKNVVERAAALTHQLLAFSRQQVLSPQILDLNVSITNLSKMLRRLIGEDIELEIRGADDLGPVKADLGQIDQVLLNLVVNARDAMPRGGKLKIETSNVALDSSYARGHFPMTPGNYVLISVSDTGKGMDEQTQARIFEPFFTTKEQGKGTGLGLATVYGIIKQSGGYIWVQSKLGKGTTFNIYLPFVKESPSVAQAKSSPTIDGGTETILLVEDEEKVRALVRRVLQARGYRVLEAHDGREALRVAENYAGPIHLLLTDVVMPGMSGRQLADRLGRLRARMKKLFMSGYTNEAIIQHGPSDPDSTILQKPFTMDALARTVREVLKRN